MKCFATLFASFVFIGGSSAFSMSRADAVAVTKARIAGLAPIFTDLSYNCFIFPKDCQIQGNSQEVLLKLLSEESARSSHEIKYGSGAENFTIDGALRIAKTGEDWGSPVIFNEDLLATAGAAGDYQPLQFFEVLGVLIHEFGHHQEKKMHDYGLASLRHEELDTVAMKVVSYLKDRTRTLRVSAAEVPGLRPENELQILNIDIEWYNGIRNVWSHQFVDNGSGVQEVSDQVFGGLRCPKEYHSGHLTFSGKAQYVAVRQVRAPQIEFANGRVTIDQAVGEASALCVDTQMQVFNVFNGYKDGKLHLEFSQNAAGVLEFGGGFFSATPPPDERF